ncbi:MAG: CocE/NonD family hydrolase, partial [Halanaerobiales bacterium]|nr:CocE/NonD family hydrolase [Halanaerobiales bacterium]
PPEVAKIVLHLTSAMGFSERAEAEETTLCYSFDPDHPVPTIGGALTSGEPIFEGGAFDQVEDEAFFGCTRYGLPLSARRDVLSFETPPLGEDLTIAGPVSVRLWVQTDGPDTDFTAKLMDVHPPSEDYPRGYAMILTDSIFRLRYRDGYHRPRGYDPSEGPVEIEITPFATANLFKAGHRIRLDISSSNFPKFDVNPNTEASPGFARTTRRATNKIVLGGRMSSRLELMKLTV